MKEKINYVITQLAVERGITFEQMQVAIEEAVYAGLTIDDSYLRGEFFTRFGSRGPSEAEFIKEIAKMLDTAHHDV